jgi:hypothetical protein
MPTAAYETTVKACSDPAIGTLGIRSAAIPLRQQVESALRSSDGNICLDFTGLMVTHGYMDGLLGDLILRYGPSLFERVAFKGCSEDVQAVIQFVATTRAQDYKELSNRAIVS